MGGFVTAASPFARISFRFCFRFIRRATAVDVKVLALSARAGEHGWSGGGGADGARSGQAQTKCGTKIAVVSRAGNECRWACERKRRCRSAALPDRAHFCLSACFVVALSVMETMVH